MGSQTARVCTHPPYVRTHGLAASRLSASAGLVLDPWQAAILDVILGVRDDGKFACFEPCFVIPRQNGKGAVFEALALFKLFVLQERLIMWSAHQLKTAGESFRRILALADNTPDLKRLMGKPMFRQGEQGLQLKTGQRLLFHARSKTSMRGYSPTSLILDEAFDINNDDMAALLPTLSAQPNAQVVYASTPPLNAAESQHLQRLRARGESGTDTSLAWWDWSVPSGTDFDNRTGWAQANPALGIRISEEAVERERNTLDNEDFGRERLGIWPELASEHVIDLSLWSSLVDKGSKRGEKLAFAVDVSPERKACIAMASIRADGKMHVELVDHKTGTAWVPERLVELRDKWNPVAIALDVGGPGGNLLLELEKVGITRPENQDRPSYGSLAVPTVREVAAACASLVDGIQHKAVRHLDEPRLNLAIANAKTRPLGDAWAWARKNMSVDISPLVAVTLARWAFEARAHLVQETKKRRADFAWL